MLVINYSTKNLCHVALGLISFPLLNDVELHNTQYSLDSLKLKSLSLDWERGI